MSKRIYVGNLPWSITKVRFEELFSPFGEMEEALVIANKYTGRSRGFGFVTYKNDADADKAMKGMNEKEVDGRRLVVKLARPSRESQEEQTEGEQKPEEKKHEPSEEKARPERGKPKKTHPSVAELKKTHPSVAELKKTRPSEVELKKKPEKKPKKEKPTEEKKEETEEEETEDEF